MTFATIALTVCVAVGAPFAPTPSDTTGATLATFLRPLEAPAELPALAFPDLSALILDAAYPYPADAHHEQQLLREHTASIRQEIARREAEEAARAEAQRQLEAERAAEAERQRQAELSAQAALEAQAAEAAALEDQPASPPIQSWSVDWDALAQCESGGNWQINTGNGYFGGLQFDLSSWRGAGGSGYPHENSREEQIKRAEIWRDLHPAGLGAWPACTRKLGWR